jgi:hypothetical protein
LKPTCFSAAVQLLRVACGDVTEEVKFPGGCARVLRSSDVPCGSELPTSVWKVKSKEKSQSQVGVGRDDTFSLI